MSKQFWAVIVAIVVIFTGAYLVSGKKSDGSKSSSSSTLTQHVEGKGTTGVTLIEYGDYQCPYCGQYYPILKQVVSEYGDQIKFQFRNFPLVSVHQNAFAGARAAEAAGMQNKYWEMHDILYENQTTWSASNDPSTYFKQYAKTLGLNATQFTTDYASSKVNDLINADMAEGNKLGITGTPSFFVNGKQVQIGQSVDAFDKVLKAAIAKQPATSAGTTTQTTESSSTTTDGNSTTNSSTSNTTTTSTSGQ